MKTLGHLLILLLPAALLYGSTQSGRPIFPLSHNPLSKYTLTVNPALVKKALGFCLIEESNKNNVVNSSNQPTPSIFTQDKSVRIEILSNPGSSDFSSMSIYNVSGLPIPDNERLLNAYGISQLSNNGEEKQFFGRITIHYSDKEINGISENQLRLSRYDPQKNQWETIASVVDTKAKTITGFVTDRSAIGLTVDENVHIQPCADVTN